MHLIGHERWMTNINSHCHYVRAHVCVCETCGETEGLCMCSLVFTCGDLEAQTEGILFVFKPNCRNNCVLSNSAQMWWAGLTIRTHTENEGREVERGSQRNKQGRKERESEFSSFLSEVSFHRIITKMNKERWKMLSSLKWHLHALTRTS